MSFLLDDCEPVHMKGPLFGTWKNETIKFYDKLALRASFPLILE